MSAEHDYLIQKQRNREVLAPLKKCTDFAGVVVFHPFRNL